MYLLTMPDHGSLALSNQLITGCDSVTTFGMPVHRVITTGRVPVRARTVLQAAQPQNLCYCAVVHKPALTAAKAALFCLPAALGALSGCYGTSAREPAIGMCGHRQAARTASPVVVQLSRKLLCHALVLGDAVPRSMWPPEVPGAATGVGEWSEHGV